MVGMIVGVVIGGLEDGIVGGQYVCFVETLRGDTADIVDGCVIGNRGRTLLERVLCKVW